MTDRGRIGWLEMNAQRVHLARPFYAGLFNWNWRALHARPFGNVAMIANGDWDFGNEFMAMGAFAVPRWTVWLRADMAHAAPRVEVLGGDPGAGVHRIAGHGLRLDATDPLGIGFGLIEAEAPMPVFDRPGDPVAAELWGPGVSALAAFYAGVLDLEARETPEGACLFGPDGPVLWLRDTAHPPTPPGWIPYFRSVAVGGDGERARRMGAITQMPPDETPGLGLLEVLSDPTGAYFGLLEPEAP